MIGVDLVKINRLNLVYKKFGKKFLDKFLTNNEQIQCKNINNVSSMWAIKEATSKALGLGIGSKCSFFDIKIYKNNLNAPKVKISKNLTKEFNIKNIETSVSHDGEYAIAVVNIIN